jgi:hypothetical protein
MNRSQPKNRKSGTSYRQSAASLTAGDDLGVTTLTGKALTGKAMTGAAMTGKRTYHRRSDDERIAALQAKIVHLQNKVETKQRPDQPVVREAPKVQKKLRDFAQLAQENGRTDIANSTIAFLAGLDRMVQSSPVENRKGRRGGDDDYVSSDDDFDE